MGLFKKALVGAAMATAVASMVGQGGAFADVVSDYLYVAGTGTITPGLPTTGCAVQTDITFNGTGLLVGDDGVTFPATINFDGNSGSTCETLTSGQGSGTVSGTITGNVTYQRTGSNVQVFGSVTINGRPHQPISADCHFDPTSANPVTSYALNCVIVFSSTGD